MGSAVHSNVHASIAGAMIAYINMSESCTLMIWNYLLLCHAVSGMFLSLQAMEYLVS